MILISHPFYFYFLRTANNPISGFSIVRLRSRDIGYASYIGITGNDEKDVKDLVDSIRKHAVYIKDESECERNFI